MAVHECEHSSGSEVRSRAAGSSAPATAQPLRACASGEDDVNTVLDTESPGATLHAGTLLLRACTSIHRTQLVSHGAPHGRWMPCIFWARPSECSVASTSCARGLDHCSTSSGVNRCGRGSRSRDSRPRCHGRGRRGHAPAGNCGGFGPLVRAAAAARLLMTRGCVWRAIFML